MCLFLCATVAEESRVRLNDGNWMPKVATGTWQYKAEEVPGAISAALQSGFRHIDTAHDYCADGSTPMTTKCTECCGGSVQKAIGEAIRNQTAVARKDLYITTKVPGCGLQGIGFDSCAEDSVTAAIDNLEELGMPYVDLLLIHFPPGSPEGWAGSCNATSCAAMQKQWTALSEHILKTNKTRSLGVSNFCVSCLECLAKVPGAVVPAVNQIQYHVGMGPDAEGVLSYTASKGIVAEAYSPLGTDSPDLINGTLTSRIGKAHGKSSAQVALRWVLEHLPAVAVKAANPKYLAEDIDILNWGLTDPEVRELDAVAKPAGKPSFMCTA